MNRALLTLAGLARKTPAGLAVLAGKTVALGRRVTPTSVELASLAVVVLGVDDLAGRGPAEIAAGVLGVAAIEVRAR